MGSHDHAVTATSGFGHVARVADTLPWVSDVGGCWAHPCTAVRATVGGGKNCLHTHFRCHRYKRGIARSASPYGLVVAANLLANSL
jgi:hypothetical protein